MCKIDDIEPDLQAGQFFDSTPFAPTGKCISTNIRCFQQAGLICTSATISSVTASGSTVIATMSGNTVEARLDCEKDGMFSSGTATKITQLACEFTGCVPPCQACDISSLTPAALPTGAVFTAVDQGSGGCQLVRVTCKRDDTITTCDSVSIIATIPSGSLQIGTVSNYDSVSVNLVCAEDRLYTFEAQTGISGLACNYVNCYSCKTCDLTAITPASMPPGTAMEFEDRMPGACKRTLVTCKRTDGGICNSVTVQAITAGGTTEIASADNDVSEATGGINCNDDGFYTDGTDRITGLNCVFDGCISEFNRTGRDLLRPSLKFPCVRCDLNAIAATGLPAGREYQSQVMPTGGDCLTAVVACSTTDGTFCRQIDINTQGGVLINSNTKSNAAGGVVSCAADGMFYTATGPEVTTLSCVYNGCKSEYQTMFRNSFTKVSYYQNRANNVTYQHLCQQDFHHLEQSSLPICDTHINILEDALGLFHRKSIIQLRLYRHHAHFPSKKGHFSPNSYRSLVFRNQ
ncbi:hypothetical protein CAEBREN_24805 [Caenorhabditis brenneri]|uniref:DUF281 domain-containing protein n=1 Tax=Caenorhabditis brenneri TaxID=135651 RepID=G0NJC2_CAEBE|nr:hypothetical protein CAEBREN_24805 [Caenorhabditis brenneri]